MKFYNTLTRKKEIFKPIKKNQVGIYSCGPTVYNFVHIGNLRSYVFADILRRYLEYKKYKIKFIMNITDIDDKTIKRSVEQKISLKKLTEKYTKEFFKDIKTLNIKKVSSYPNATDHIDEMIKFTEVLEKKGYAYERLGSVYFDISKFENYGKLARVDFKGIKAGARVDLDEYDKDHPGDFTLLKRSALNDIKRGIFYQTKYGKIRPGWHIECSVMSMKYLGKTFDIHTGGIDLMFPHHENEIAQSEAYSGKKFVNYWMHNEHLLVENQKMSKSLGNFYTLRDLLDKGHNPRAIRYLLLSVHYRQKLNFTFQGLKATERVLRRLDEFVDKIKAGAETEVELLSVLTDRSSTSVSAVSALKLIDNLILNSRKDFEKAMDDDLNISKALAVIFDLIKKVNKMRVLKNTNKLYNLILEFDQVLGLGLGKAKQAPVKINSKIQQLIQKREQARQNKDWKTADVIRKQLIEGGHEVRDTKSWRSFS
ncbi:cysteine--tRNA ligase [Patescibacteria group bacterium]|nr:cysteine--tRNA ligase [Patescibacteria group bacterium]